MSRFVYSGEKLKEISFPIGGIGTGSLGLSGTGRFVDWEIYNRPNKGSLNGFTHFAVKVEEEGKLVDARIMNSDLFPPFMGNVNSEHYNGFGFGPSRYTLAGVPHFKDAVFTGKYPKATIDFSDPVFPGNVSIQAWNPLIPLQEDDSSLPLAIFDLRAENTSEKTRDFVFAFSVNNPLKKGNRYNRYLSSGSAHYMQLLSTHTDSLDPDYGDLTLSVEHDRVSCQQDWFKGIWFDNLAKYWQDFTRPGDLVNRYYPPQAAGTRDERESVATLTARITLQSGESKTVRFALAWNFPNAYNYWNPVVKEQDCSCSDNDCGCTADQKIESDNTWKNYYATLFRDSLDTLNYLFTNMEKLETETNAFCDALYHSSLPEAALEALTANISLLRSPTCLRLTDGSFYGFEGCHCYAGCCEGSCTHVWNYAYALPYLFPRLERSMRELDYQYNFSENGAMSFRLQLPIGRQKWGFRPCVDGQMGGIIKVYREWLIYGNLEWLKNLWPKIKKSIEYAWSDENMDRWDPTQNGYMDGRQHHTLDMELFGPNAWLSGFYLAALNAGTKMAAAVGDNEAGRLYQRIYDKGRKWVNENLFNGEYFQQLVELKDEGILDSFQNDSLVGAGIKDAYWNAEDREIKYQIGEGSSIDQVLAQWHSDLIGLDDVFDRDKVISALRSIYKYNYHDSFRNVFNPCRLYCLDDESGTVICAWPDDKYKPVVPAPYSEETMHGFEYQAGIHMIMNGLEKEGLRVVKAVRDRYDGLRRNPWNEIECGSNYARSMASFALMIAYSGFKCDMHKKHISFAPLHADSPYQFFWSVNDAWGTITSDGQDIQLKVLGGCLRLDSLAVKYCQAKQIILNEQIIQFNQESENIIFSETVVINSQKELKIRS